MKLRIRESFKGHDNIKLKCPQKLRHKYDQNGSGVNWNIDREGVDLPDDVAKHFLEHDAHIFEEIKIPKRRKSAT